MADYPGFIFYPGDYLRDTQNLSEKSQVAYDRIMCEHMRNICITQQQLKFFTKRLSPDEVEELKMVLTGTVEGFYIKWVRESIEKSRKYSDSRRKNREGTGKKQKGKRKNISKSYVPHMENESENESSIDIGTENESENNIEVRKSKFFTEVSLFRNQYPDELLKEFFEYWSEHNPNAEKFRKEFEKVFDIDRRLKTWNKNKDKFSKHGNGKQTSTNTVADIIAASQKVAAIRGD